MLEIDFSGDDERATIHQQLLADGLAASFLRLESRPSGAWGLTVLLSDSNEISRLHREFFNDASDTDVMSFPAGDDLEGDGGYLGDIAISIDVATAQAAEQRHSLRRELVFLALHGILHLLGWTDDNESERRDMLATQMSLLERFERERGGVL